MSRKSILRNYLGFSRSERYGILGLCGCILSVIVARLLLPCLIEREIPDIAAYGEEIARFGQAGQRTETQPVQEEREQEVANLSETEFFYFDPNSASDEELEKLGLNARQIGNIRNYQAKGGQFRRKEDFQKLYTIPITQYKQLAPYIRIVGDRTLPAKRTETAAVTVTDNRDVARAIPTKLPARQPVSIELNTSDSSLLTQLPGIGPVLAARIVKYRNRIGGYSDVLQLGEVYGINPELVTRLTPQLSVDRSLLRKIQINTATFRDLIGHPYFNEQQTKGVLYYRKMQGRINNPDELVRNNILTREEADRIEPYISFE